MWYAYDPRLPYKDWLRLSAVERAVDSAAQKNAKQIVGEVEQVKRDLVESGGSASAELARQLDATRGSIERGFDRVSGQLDDISLSLDTFHADFNWAMQVQHRQLEDMKGVLEQIRTALERRHRTEAFEFFQLSLEYEHHGMFAKALDSVQIAIHGNDRVQGYELEWRFWEQLGKLRLGSVQNNAPKIVDPKAAEEAFLQAARLAERNNANAGAARCYTAAGWAASSMGNLDRSTLYLDNAVACSPKSLEALWLKSRNLWQVDNLADAKEILLTVLKTDYTYGERLYKDPIFANTPNRLKDLINRISDFSDVSHTLRRIQNAERKVDHILTHKEHFKSTTLESTKNDLEKIAALNNKSDLISHCILAFRAPYYVEKIQDRISKECSTIAYDLKEKIKTNDSWISDLKTNYFYSGLALLWLAPPLLVTILTLVSGEFRVFDFFWMVLLFVVSPIAYIAIPFEPDDDPMKVPAAIAWYGTAAFGATCCFIIYLVHTSRTTRKNEKLRSALRSIENYQR